jgi:uncharacterized cupin superfamily protein
MVREASFEPVGSGPAPGSEGWFVVNVRNTAWERNAFGDACFFEHPEAPFDELGVSLRVLWPGRSTWLYHAESAQEALLVLAGKALLLVEDQERSLAVWDFVHWPPGTRHPFRATGTEPCVILMVGARPTPQTYFYPRTPLAIAHGVAAHIETRSPQQAQEPFAEWAPSDAGTLPGLPWTSAPTLLAGAALVITEAPERADTFAAPARAHPPNALRI